MKELSIEQKAKAYDKVIEKAKIYNSDNTQQVVKNLVTYLFPEIKESEDERIRKGLIENFKWFCGDFPETTKWGKDDDLLVKDIIDWLEKQGELDDNIITNDDEILQAISVGLTDVVEDAGWSDFGGIPIKEIQDWLKKKSQTFTKKDIDDAYLKGVCDAKQELEKQGKVPVTVHIEKMVRDYANNKERGNEEFGKPVNCMIRAYRQGLNDAISTLVLNKQDKQKSVDKVEPKFKVGDTMRTFREAENGYTDGMPVVVSIDNEYYHCTNELIAIKDQDDYEFPPINLKQKSSDNIEPKFHEGDWIISEVTGSVYQIKYCVENLNTHKYGYNLTNGCYIGSYDANHYHLWTVQDAKDGDVLYDGNNACLFRKRLKDDSAIWIDAYCGVNSDGMFNINYKNECWCLACDCVPATKEQRDLLFQKMKEAGYEFDFEKKELKMLK